MSCSLWFIAVRFSALHQPWSTHVQCLWLSTAWRHYIESRTSSLPSYCLLLVRPPFCACHYENHSNKMASKQSHVLIMTKFCSEVKIRWRKQTTVTNYRLLVMTWVITARPTTLRNVGNTSWEIAVYIRNCHCNFIDANIWTPSVLIK